MQMTGSTGEQNVMDGTVATAGFPLSRPRGQSRLTEADPKQGSMAERTFTHGDFEAEAMPHLNDLFRTASRVLKDPARAEDVVQEVYLQAWKSFHRFEPGTNCKAWLYKILFHSVNHYRRKWFRLRLLSENEEYLEDNLTYSPPVAEHLTDDEILAALDKIPADFKNVVLLVDVEEFAYKDVAEILAIPIGTVMSRLSRGRKLLREHLAQVAQSYGIGKAAVKGTAS
jgi:RNA polymerase sigma-70 factor, ECF subfamily